GEAGGVSVPGGEGCDAGGVSRPDEGRAGGDEVRRRCHQWSDCERAAGGGGRETAGARATGAVGGFGRAADDRPRGGDVDPIFRLKAAGATARLPDGGEPVPIEGSAEHLYRFERCERAADRGQLYDADGAVEIELPVDFWREIGSTTGRLGDRR